jgi:hypothetical protein
MATYAELLSLQADEALFNKVRVACWVAADTIRAEADTVPNHTARVAWAKRVFESPDAMARVLMPAVLAQNKAASVAAINGATDALVQSAVDAAVDVVL